MIRYSLITLNAVINTSFLGNEASIETIHTSFLVNSISNSLRFNKKFNILYDLFGNTFSDPETVSMTNDDIYRLSLSKKLDYEFDVEVIMSAQQGESYFELIETLSYKVLGDTNNISKTFWIVLEYIMRSTNTPAEELKKIEDYYKNALSTL